MAGVEKICGALLCAACGDALGYPLVNLTTERIQRRFGPFGLRTLVRDPRNEGMAPISEHTQLLLATVDGLLWADAKKMEWQEGIYRGYMRWYYNQTGEEPRQGQRTWMRRQPHERDVCLVREKWMHARRTSEDGLLTAFMANTKGTTSTKVNDNPGSAVLSRAIPIGILYGGNGSAAFEEGVNSGALSHSQSAAYQACGALSAIIANLAANVTLPKTLERIHRLLSKTNNTSSLSLLLSTAEEQANARPAGKTSPWAHLDALTELGTGKTAEEALAMAIYTVLAVDDPLEALIVASNNSNHSQAVATIVGGIEGIRHGTKFLPPYWTDFLEGRETILTLGEKMAYLYKKTHTK